MPFVVGQYLSPNDLNSNEDAHIGNGVVTGLQVTEDAPVGMDVEVQIGQAYVAGNLINIVAATDLVVGAADPANPRKDIVVLNSAGVLSVVAGVAAAALPAANIGIYTLEPAPPLIPANSIILAEIWVPAAAVQITNTEIYDKRVFIGDFLSFNPAPGTNDTGSGVITTDTVGENVDPGEICYMKADGKYWLADADADTTTPALVMAMETILANNAGKLLHLGYFRHDAWTWVLGNGAANNLYASITPGAMSQTAPVGAGDQVQVVGYVVTADVVFFNPCLELVEVF